MVSNNITNNNDILSSKLLFYNLSARYSIIPLSFSDLYTYEVIILLLYGIMIIFSFFTNLIAIIIFFFGRRSRSELTPFFLNLSVFNIIMTVYCIPFTITSIIFQRWLYARSLCVVLDGFKTFSVSGVLLTLITIAIDRYGVVKYPLAIKIYSSKKRNLFAILIIWILSIALALIWSPARSLPLDEQRLWVSSRTLIHHFIEILDNTTRLENQSQYLENFQFGIVNTIQCTPNRTRKPVEFQRTILNFLQTYFFPLFILTFVYLRIALILWQRRSDFNFDPHGLTGKNLFTNENIQFKRKLKQGIKMLIAVVVLHAVLWLPMNVFQLCINLICHKKAKHSAVCEHPTLFKHLYIACHFLTVSNTAIHPIIYGFTNNRFRSDIRQLSRRLIHCQTRSPIYFQARFGYHHPPIVVDRLRKSKRKQNVTATMNQISMRKSTSKRPLSLVEQNKYYRNNHPNKFVQNDQFFIRTMHTN